MRFTTPLCTPVYSCVPLCTPVYPCVPMCTPVYPYVPLCIPMYPCVPLCTHVYPCVPLCTPVSKSPNKKTEIVAYRISKKCWYKCEAKFGWWSAEIVSFLMPTHPRCLASKRASRGGIRYTGRQGRILGLSKIIFFSISDFRPHWLAILLD